MAIPPLLKIALTESADLLVRTIKVTIMVTALTLTLLLIGWFFSSSLPQQALMMLNGK